MCWRLGRVLTRLSRVPFQNLASVLRAASSSQEELRCAVAEHRQHITTGFLTWLSEQAVAEEDLDRVGAQVAALCDTCVPLLCVCLGNCGVHTVARGY